MNKLLLAAIFASTTALADSGVYLKSGIGLNHINQSYHKDSLYTSKLKLKHLFPVITLGGGYQFDNDYRIEVVMDYYFLFSQAERSNIGDSKFHLNLDTKITDIMFNAYKSFDIGHKIKPFVGVGLGISSIKDEGTGYKINDVKTEVLAPAYGNQVYRPAYRLTVGADYEISNKVVGEISYSYLNLGQNKPKSIEGVDNIPKHKFHVHNVSLGVRFLL